MKLLVYSALLLIAGMSFAGNYARYTYSEYQTDASDGVAGVYFAAVYPSGSTANTNGAYVVLGGVYPVRTSNGVSGNVKIPETLLGLPVRRIGVGAFTTASNIKSIELPSTLREVDDRAFAFCTGLTNVVFKSPGAVRLGESVFSNCVSLVNVEFPKNLSYIAPGIFKNCNALRTVHFNGDAPELDDSWHDPHDSYFGDNQSGTGVYPARAKFYINRNTYGWIAPYRAGIPERWPISRGWMNAHEMEYWPGSSNGFSLHVTKSE